MRGEYIAVAVLLVAAFVIGHVATHMMNRRSHEKWAPVAYRAYVERSAEGPAQMYVIGTDANRSEA